MLRIWSCFECNPHCWVQSVDWPFKFKVYNAAQRIQPTHTVNFTRLQCRLCERAFLIMIHRPDRIPAHGARCAHQAPSMNHYPNDSPYVWRFKKNINKFNTAFSTATGLYETVQLLGASCPSLRIVLESKIWIGDSTWKFQVESCLVSSLESKLWSTPSNADLWRLFEQN